MFGKLANIINIKENENGENYIREIINSCSVEKDLYNQMFKQDCSGYDIVPTILPKAKRIFVLGDVHGDFEMVIKLLKMAKVINEYNEWIAKPDTIVVQVGDQVDRCRPYKYTCDVKEATVDDENSDVKILEFFTELDKKAQLNNGRVISLLGNHEILNSMGIMNYVSYKGRNDFTDIDPITGKEIITGIKGRKEAFKPGGRLANFMACTRVSCIIIGSNIFVHAGIVPLLIEKYNIQDAKGLGGINTVIRKWLLNQIVDKSIKNEMNTLLNDIDTSPFWPRILGYIPPNAKMDHTSCATYLKPVLEKIKIGKIGNMIIGHTPQFHTHETGINSACDNKLWRVDIGASKAFEMFDEEAQKHKGVISEGRRLQVLKIKDDDKFSIIDK
jgi:hypothetical protein